MEHQSVPLHKLPPTLWVYGVGAEGCLFHCVEAEITPKASFCLVFHDTRCGLDKAMGPLRVAANCSYSLRRINETASVVRYRQ